MYIASSSCSAANVFTTRDIARRAHTTARAPLFARTAPRGAARTPAPHPIVILDCIICASASANHAMLAVRVARK
jgi:hypothetical protein